MDANLLRRIYTLRDDMYFRCSHLFTLTMLDETWMMIQPTNSVTPPTCFLDPKSAFQSIPFPTYDGESCSNFKLVSLGMVETHIDEIQEELTALKSITAVLISKIYESIDNNSINRLNPDQLKELILNKLHKIFETAIKKIVNLGYKKTVAEEGVIRYGFISYGLKDPVTNIVDTVLSFWNDEKEVKVDSVGKGLFEDLEDLKEFLFEMMVHFVKNASSLSEIDAMRCILSSQMSSPRNPYENLEQLLMSYDKKDEVRQILKLIPKEEKDKIIDKMLARIKELEKKKDEWRELANRMVKETIRRLMKDTEELKTLRKEKEETTRLMKGKMKMDETFLKKSYEVDKKLSEIASQIDLNDEYTNKLEEEQSNLSEEIVVAGTKDFMSEGNCKSAKNRVKKAMNKLKAIEKQNNLEEIELRACIQKREQLERELVEAKQVLEEMEGKRKQPHETKEKLLLQVSAIRKEREEIEVLPKLKEEQIKQKVEKELKEAKEEIQKLEKEISELKQKNGMSSKSLSQEVIQLPEVSPLMDKLSIFKWKGEKGRAKECVFCFAEERSVVFLPCAHQIICRECNQIHETQGIKECPLCKTPIEQRIVVRNS